MMEPNFKTNADFIRSLSIDELAVVINHPCNYCVYEHPFCIEQEVHCANGIRQWLNSPYHDHPLSDVCERILKEAREGRIFGEEEK